jgi:hypothetical protein
LRSAGGCVWQRWQCVSRQSPDLLPRLRHDLTMAQGAMRAPTTPAITSGGIPIIIIFGTSSAPRTSIAASPGFERAG